MTHWWQASKNAFVAAGVCACAHVLAMPITTNSLYANVCVAEGLAASGQVRAAAGRLAAQAAPLSAPVLTWKGGCITWGFYRGLHDAQVLLLDQDPARAYRALLAAAAGLPGYDHVCDERLAWCLSMARCCAALWRGQDARRYAAYVQRHSPSGSVWECRAQVALAWSEYADGLVHAARDRLRAFDTRGEMNSDDLLLRAHCEFLTGNAHGGAAALWRAAAARCEYTIPAARDPLFRAVRRYWLLLNSYDQLDWFAFLERALASNALAHASADWISYCANTRLLLQRVYPDILVLHEDDKAALRAMAEATRAVYTPYQVPAETYRRAEALSPIEDALNQLLARMVNTDEGEDDGSGRIEQPDLPFTTSALARVTINDTNARFAVPWARGMWHFWRGNYADAGHNLYEAVSVREGMASPTWYAWAAVSYAQICQMLGRDARELYEDAQMSAPQRSRVAAVAETALAACLIGTGSTESVYAALEGIVTRYQALAPAQAWWLRAQLAYARRDYRAGCVALCEGFAYRPPTAPRGDNRFVRALCGNRSLHTYAELERIRALLRGAAAAQRPSARDMATAMWFLARAEEPWWEDELRLARAEEAGVWDDEVSNIVARSSSVRAARVHLAAQAQRDASGTNALDWSVWERACQAVRGEDEQWRWPGSTPVGGVEALLDNLTEQLHTYSTRLAPGRKEALMEMVTRQRAHK